MIRHSATRNSGAFRAGAAALAALALCGARPARAVPVFGNSEMISGIQVFRDDKNPRLYYFGPGKLVIPRDAAGVPDISFLQTRYTGTRVTGDQGKFRTQSILSFRVRMQSATKPQLDAIRLVLARRGPFQTLQPLQLRRVETTLNYTPLKGDAPPAPEAEKALGNGGLQSDEKAVPADEFWTERTYTVAPDELTSQALWDAMQTGKVILSLSYAFIGEGISVGDAKPKTGGNVKIDLNAPDAKVAPRLALADVLAVTVEASKLPNCLKRVDLNDLVPANYPGLPVYCYDFNNALRPDLEEKTVEIEAVSVTGKPVRKDVRFSRTAADVSSATARFQFAVSLKQPYRYRLHELTTEGEERVGPWREGKAWSQILDVTTPADQLPKPAPKPDEESK